MKKTIAFILIMITNVLITIATPQRGDIVHWNDSIYRVRPFPLDLLWEDVELTSEFLFGIEEKGYSTECGRGYQAEWEIIDNELYLIAIYSCNYYEDSLKADLFRLFPEKCKNGIVKADWVRDDFWLTKGKTIYYDHSLTGNIYEKEIRLTIEDGFIMDSQEFNNLEKSIISVYTENPEVLKEFIYSHINWELVSELKDNTVKVLVSFQIRKPGKIQNVAIELRAGEPYDSEAKRVVSLIPEWTIYYTHGKYMATYWNIPVVFSEENRNKYGR